jgi:hypothetical protein
MHRQINDEAQRIAVNMGKLPELLRKIGIIRRPGGDPPGLLAGEQVRRRAPAGLILEIDISELLPGARSRRRLSIDQGGEKRRKSN